MLKSTFNGLQRCHPQYVSFRFIRLAVVASQICEITRNLWQFKIIQSHRFWCQSKAHIRLPVSN